jgi:hypothetical protein
VRACVRACVCYVLNFVLVCDSSTGLARGPARRRPDAVEAVAEKGDTVIVVANVRVAFDLRRYGKLDVVDCAV